MTKFSWRKHRKHLVANFKKLLELVQTLDTVTLKWQCSKMITEMLIFVDAQHWCTFPLCSDYGWTCQSSDKPLLDSCFFSCNCFIFENFIFFLQHCSNSSILIICYEYKHHQNLTFHHNHPEIKKLHFRLNFIEFKS